MLAKSLHFFRYRYASMQQFNAAVSNHFSARTTNYFVKSIPFICLAPIGSLQLPHNRKFIVTTYRTQTSN